ncbi:unnamed protein product [Rotaria sp. Silwood1]|nr:unnamed protein product [Rotaria sp. Silwood1]CAF1279092.1 unnamed protein product [Rotaria sp. Silwood1]CAF3523654.1 unnamed protein product [Rotaria sp. Silwood1]CAF4689090.1 unnamed protein product [Rotaria sp. Silwood1]CAF4760614.1 unnamed protein product [Rotaria sp. Silwood1]
MSMNNTITSYHTTYIDESTAIVELISKDYDLTGAILFIIVVLLWYSMGMVCMLGMQIKVRDETFEYCEKRRPNILIETLRDQTHTKQILEELVDKQKRDKLWDIYLGTTENNNDKLIRDEINRIRNIEKQLAIINQNRILINESLISSSTSNNRINSDTQSIIIPDLSSIENRVRVRRRSSLDQQIIERWKTLVEQCKTHEQLPWTIQKLMIRRHFRRYCKTILREPEHINTSMYEPSEYVNNKQYDLVMNRKMNMENYPHVINKPDHHVIQLDSTDGQ